MACKDYRELTRCWGALYIWICYKTPVSIEQAFQLWDNGTLEIIYGNNDVNEDIVRMRREGALLKDIAYKHNLTLGAVFKRIEYYAPELIERE